MIAMTSSGAKHNMKKASNTSRGPLGFSLAEVLAALTIGAMILVAVLGIYNRAERSAAAITRKLDSSRLPCEVLQRIAEDLDNVIAAGKDVKVAFVSKIETHGYQTAELTIAKTIYDSKNQPKDFEKIVWRSSYDYESDANGLVLYRSHSGIALEDKLLDETKENWEKELFVPICTGVTFFKIQAPRGETFQDSWTSTSLPPGIVATISFAEPVKTVRGGWDVPDEEKIARTIAVDRKGIARKIKFKILPKESEKEKGNEGQKSK